MVLKLHGASYSTCTKRVLTALKETNTPYELVPVDLSKGEHKSPEFLAKQPFGQVPYLDDDGFTIFESRAIARYIAAKAGSPLLPTGDLKKVAAFETAASIELANFDFYASTIAYERVFAPMRGQATNEELVKNLAAAFEGKLAGYEALLKKHKYLAGDEVTLADLYHLPYGSMLAPQGFKFLEDSSKFPNVARWWKDITSRPSWQEIIKG
jgi:glutathione S-transferase